MKKSSIAVFFIIFALFYVSKVSAWLLIPTYFGVPSLLIYHGTSIT
ncbi:hypothetical protein [Fictibacillus phosphorivorans]|nr:hypothetical protein [Fictibacillus phosphorivorans]